MSPLPFHSVAAPPSETAATLHISTPQETDLASTNQPQNPASPTPEKSSRVQDVAHLSYRQKTNLGSFYTPPHIVRLVYDTLARNAPADFADALLEPACGYGAFFSENFPQSGVRRIGADLDPDALAVARREFPDIPFFHTNALAQITRTKYDIRENERLVVVGNPPYNDVTSHVKNRVKSTPCEIDPAVRTRDLGLSFLLAVAKLNPDYIAVLHPLSYLIKEANFRILRPLLRTHALRDAVVFSSQEFSETSKGCGFPIVAAVYAKDSSGTTYEQIRQRRFRTLEGDTLSLADYDYVCRYITKYPARFPGTGAPAGRLRFFTMRDINALKRSRTFITEDTDNTIYIQPEKLSYYCYVDAFKDIADTLPYYLGNFDVPINHSAFDTLRDDFFTLSIAKHPTIFSTYPQPNLHRLHRAREKVDNYFQQLFQTRKQCS
jgi:hypothetical protein